MAKPVPEVVALLESLLADARRGEIRDAFVLFRCRDGEYDHAYNVDDVPDLLYELGTAILTIRIEG